MAYSGDGIPSCDCDCDCDPGGVEYPDIAGPETDADDDDEGKKHAGPLVGPAMGCVGARVFDSVTTRLWPSQPVEDKRSDRRPGQSASLKKEHIDQK